MEVPGVLFVGITTEILKTWHMLEISKIIDTQKYQVLKPSIITLI